MPTSSPPHAAAPDSTGSHRPPEAWRPLWQLARLTRRPVERFLGIQAASSVILLAATATALVLANSRWQAGYEHLLHLPFGVQLGALSFQRPLEWWVNDALMVIFFFVVGLEIRREIYQGELSKLRRAALPVLAALGGMLIPALVASRFMHDTAAARGWAIPMATDIAFAIGILTLLGDRVPPALRVLLLALAVIDDLGAIVIIAAFYSDGIQTHGLLIAAAGLLTIFAMQWIGVRRKALYVVPGLITWVGFYQASIHPTLAGVVIGLATPVRAWTGVEPQSPSEELVDALHPWVAYLIMPAFALVNAGVSLQGIQLGPTELRAFTGVFAGLVIGKPLGIVLICWLAIKLRIASLPNGLSTRHLLVLGLVAGVGFTMSLFLAQLAFDSQALLEAAKVGVLAGSGLAAVIGLVLGRALMPRRQHDTPGARSEHDAERSCED